MLLHCGFHIRISALSSTFSFYPTFDPSHDFPCHLKPLLHAVSLWPILLSKSPPEVFMQPKSAVNTAQTSLPWFENHSDESQLDLLSKPLLARSLI